MYSSTKGGRIGRSGVATGKRTLFLYHFITYFALCIAVTLALSLNKGEKAEFFCDCA